VFNWFEYQLSRVVNIHTVVHQVANGHVHAMHAVESGVLGVLVSIAIDHTLEFVRKSSQDELVVRVFDFEHSVGGIGSFLEFVILVEF